MGVINDNSKRLVTETQKKQIRFKLNAIPLDFLSSTEANADILNLLEQITLCREQQDDMDNLYKAFQVTIIDEMKRKLEILKPPSSLKKRFKPKKPYWTDELDNLFKTMVLKEREFRKCKFRDNKRRLLNQFKASRHEFDKNLKNTK